MKRPEVALTYVCGGGALCCDPVRFDFDDLDEPFKRYIKALEAEVRQTVEPTERRRDA